MPPNQPVGTIVVWTANALCSPGAIPEYGFYVANVFRQNYSTNNTFVWDTSLYGPGHHGIGVAVHARGGQPLEQAKQNSAFVVSGAALPADNYYLRLAKDDEVWRERRRAEMANEQLWEQQRWQRAEEHRRQMAGLWGEYLLRRPETQQELQIHADRIARLNYIVYVAEQQNNPMWLQRAQAAIIRENRRHARVMGEFRVQFPQ